MRKHKSGLMQVQKGRRWVFVVSGFTTIENGVHTACTMIAESSDGHLCKVHARIMPKSAAVVYNGLRIPAHRWEH